LNEIIIYSKEQLLNIVGNNPAVIAYFSTKDCNICKILKPKILGLLTAEFSRVKFVYVNVNNHKELSAQNSVFTVPTIIFYAEGRETLRYSRNINLDEFSDTVGRVYRMLFDI
jgi:thiol-disulfide isomerase/thioredoxin